MTLADIPIAIAADISIESVTESEEGKNAKELNAEADDLREFATKLGTGAPNPHVSLACSSCHREIPEDTSYLSAVNSLNMKPSELCMSCHPDYANIHPVDWKPSMSIPEYLPLDGEGKLTCTTCHRLHDPNAEFQLLRGFLDGEFQHRRDLCFACHGSDLFTKNPHKAKLGEKRCTFCHQTVPTDRDTAKTVTFKLDVIRMCNFCHDVQRRFHPLNVDTSISIPANLPRSSTGQVTCGTCHNPHGEAETVHFLRAEYVESIEMIPGKGHGINPDCAGCHAGKLKKGVVTKLRFEGKITVLCNSCHGSSSDMHPVDIQIPRGAQKPEDLPLSQGDRITCLTCHDVDCSFPEDTKTDEGVSIMKLLSGDKKSIEALLIGKTQITSGKSIISTRFFDRKTGKNDLCFKCHQERQFKAFSPHMGIDYRKMENFDPRHCKFCHDIDPSRGSGTLDSVKFISNPRMICLRCHPERPHPSNFDHLVKPDKIRVPKNLPLDMDGKVTCSTCHDPHTSTVGISKSRSGDASICVFCHRK